MSHGENKIKSPKRAEVIELTPLQAIPDDAAPPVFDQQRFAKEVMESEEKFRLLANAAPVFMWMSDVSMKCVWVNRSWLEFTGRSLKQELNDGWLSGVHPDDLPRLIETYTAAFEAKRKFEMDYRLRRHDGKYRWLLDRGQPLTTPDGDFAGYIGSCIDVHEQREMMIALRESEERFKTLADGAPVFIWMMDKDGFCDFANRAFVEFFGGDLYKLRGPGWLANIHKDDAGQFLDAYRDAFDKSGSFNARVRIRRSDGEWRVVDCHASPPSSKTSSRDYVATGIDITERVAAEDITTRYRLLYENSSDVIWFARLDGSFVDVNQSAIETYGYTREEFLSMNIRDIRHPSAIADLRGQLDAANNGSIHYESLHVRKDGTAIPVEVKANGADFGGERLFMAIVRDVTERKRREQTLRDTEVRRQLAHEAGDVGVFDWDIVNDTAYWSESMWQLYGLPVMRPDPDMEFWGTLVHPNDLERVKLHLSSVLNSKEERFRDEFRIVYRDGSIRWIESKGRIQRDKKGKAVRMSGVNFDITQRKDAEQKIRLNENQLRLVMNTIPAMISYVDRQERYRFVNGKLVEWFDKPTEHLVGSKVREVIGANAYRIIKPHIDAVLSGIETTFEAQLLYKGVGPRYIHGSFVPDTGVDGTVYGYYELTRDLTDIKRSEDLLRSTEARLGLLMDSMIDHAILSMDVKGRIDSWNKGAEVIFGYTQQEIIGKSAEILFTPEDREAGIPAKEMRKAKRAGKALDQRWHLRKDKSRFFADGVMMPLFVGAELTGYAKIASDLTERKHRDEELQRVRDQLENRVRERTKELVASNVALVQEMEEREAVEIQRGDLLRRLVSSQELERRRIARDLHDQLGQRLTALRLKIASLKDATAELPDISTRVERLQEIAERLDSEVSFLAWELRPSALDDLGMAEAIAAFVSEWSRHYDIATDFRSGIMLDERLPRDTETHLYRITQEALNNIAKHAFANHVTVLLESREQSVILIIEDDGKGFDPSKVSKPRESGKGLGLLGMRERAALIGGDVEVESAVDHGTTIYVRVPITYKGR